MVLEGAWPGLRLIGEVRHLFSELPVASAQTDLQRSHKSCNCYAASWTRFHPATTNSADWERGALVHSSLRPAFDDVGADCGLSIKPEASKPILQLKLLQKHAASASSLPRTA